MERMEKQVWLVKKVKIAIYQRLSKKLECIRKNTSHCIVKPTMGERFQMAMYSEQFY